jgi:hypothetical protein
LSGLRDDTAEGVIPSTSQIHSVEKTVAACAAVAIGVGDDDARYKYKIPIIPLRLRLLMERQREAEQLLSESGVSTR